MIYSMTAFGSAKTEFELGYVLVEIRSVNNRFLDLNLRMPDSLRTQESVIRQQISSLIQRGKVEARIQLKSKHEQPLYQVQEAALHSIAHQLNKIRDILPNTPTPNMTEIIHLCSSLQGEQVDDELSKEWLEQVMLTLSVALDNFNQMRLREAERLSKAMLEITAHIEKSVQSIEQQLPILLEEYLAKIQTKLSEAITTLAPQGFQQISGTELSGRIAIESTLFGLRTDVAEEFTRLKSHTLELKEILAGTQQSTTPRQSKQSLGKRLDFLFQEMNREINTLGSKSSSLIITDEVINMKLWVEQLREQALNLE